MAEKKAWKTTDDKVTGEDIVATGTTPQEVKIVAGNAQTNHHVVADFGKAYECKCAEKDAEIARLTRLLDMESSKSDLEPLKKEIGGTASGHVFKIASAKVMIAIAERLDGIDKSLALIAAKK
jgi:hypothetical protein